MGRRDGRETYGTRNPRARKIARAAGVSVPGAAAFAFILNAICCCCPNGYAAYP